MTDQLIKVLSPASCKSSIRAMPTIPLLNQQDLQALVPGDLIPERQANVTIEDIAAAYTPPPNIS